VQVARVLAEEAFDDGTVGKLRPAIGELSVRLSQLEVDHRDVAFEWLVLNKRLLDYKEDLAHD
jgi:hypothetical protein